MSHMSTNKNITFPFSAIIGQEEMKKGLILNVIHPKIGGILVFGEKGQETKALLYMQDRQEKGVVCEYAVCETLQQAKDYSCCSGIHRLAIVGEQVREVEV